MFASLGPQLVTFTSAAAKDINNVAFEPHFNFKNPHSTLSNCYSAFDVPLEFAKDVYVPQTCFR